MSLTLALATASGISTTSGNADGLTSAPAIDLDHPNATISDPAGSLAPVDTECHPGQVDLNQALPRQLVESFRLITRQTADRIIQRRPWLRGSDLSSVPGIVPPVAARLSQITCATQPALPPASPIACDPSRDQVDLQTATAQKISSRLGLLRVTGLELVRARPLPQDLYQLSSPRIPGFGKWTIDELLESRRVCVTPAPMLAGGSAWRWATAASGAIVRRDGFALIVPPGRITAPLGAYISVTPLPLQDGILPAMDAQIHGAWRVGATTVGVQGPWIGDELATPLVMHDAADGLRMSTGTGTRVSVVDGRPTATATQTSLSPTTFGNSMCDPAIGDGFAKRSSLACIPGLSDADVSNEWRRTASERGTGARSTLTERPSCGSAIVNPGNRAKAVSLGKLPWGVRCDPGTPGDKMTWRFVNDAHGSVGLASVDVLFKFGVHGGTFDPPRISGSAGADLVKNAILGLLQGRDVNVLGPQQELSVTKTVNSGETYADVSVDFTATGAWLGITELLDTLGGKAWDEFRTDKPFEATSLLSRCSDAGLNAAGIECVKSLVVLLAGYAEQKTLSFSKSARGFFASVKRIVLPLTIGEWVTTFALAMGSAASGGDGVLLRYNTPAPPVKGPGGGDPPPSYIARDPSSPIGRSVLVEGNSVQNIPDGGTFLCLAASRYVYDVSEREELDVQPSRDATCHAAGPTWDFNPKASGGNTENSVILRERPEDATGGRIASWLINSQGQIQTIPDGGTYLCLAYDNPVIWNVPYEKVAAWRPVGTAPATCGAP